MFVPCKYVNTAELSGNTRGGHRDRSDSGGPNSGAHFHMWDPSGFCPLSAFSEPTGKAGVSAFQSVVREEAKALRAPLQSSEKLNFAGRLGWEADRCETLEIFWQ